jgi:hypothetical protein
MVAWIVYLLSCFPKITGIEICHNLTAQCLGFQQVQGKVWATDCGRDRQTCIRQAEANWICSCRGESFLLWSSPSVAEHCGIGKFWSHEMSQLWLTRREKFELILHSNGWFHNDQQHYSIVLHVLYVVGICSSSDFLKDHLGMYHCFWVRPVFGFFW